MYARKCLLPLCVYSVPPTPGNPFPSCQQQTLGIWVILSSSQRWASTLANRSNARHWSNIRAPPRPLPPDVCIQSVGICVTRGAGGNSWLAGVSGCHICPCTPCPSPKRSRSKVESRHFAHHCLLPLPPTPPILCKQNKSYNCIERVEWFLGYVTQISLTMYPLCFQPRRNENSDVGRLVSLVVLTLRVGDAEWLCKKRCLTCK